MELTFVFIAIGFTWAGVAVIRKSLRSDPFPDRPERSPTLSALGTILGLGLLATPWLLLWALFSTISQIPLSLGRVLRIKRRAHLPTLTTGDDWTAVPVELQSPLSPAERTALGQIWTDMARAEQASVPAFSQLSLQLSALGAPARLLTATHRAALEEVEHAQRCFAIARAITGSHLSAGPIEALLKHSPAAIDLPRLALESLTDGCFGEGLAADIAERGADIATEPAVTTFLAAIAREEASHAELAWQILAWSLEQGGDSVRRAVALGLAHLASPPPLSAANTLSPSTLSRFGLLDQTTLNRLSATRLSAVSKRTRSLLEAPVLQAA